MYQSIIVAFLISSSVLIGSGVYAFTIESSYQKYEPTWDSINSRPLPEWYDEAKIGIFMHFGVYSVPGMGQGFWKGLNESNQKIVDFMEANYPPNFTYQDFGAELKMEFWDPKWFAEVVQNSGAKYLVFTTKHHEGFTNWPSTYHFGWNSMDIGPKKNVIKDLKDAFAENAPDVKFGLYYSLREWFNPIFLIDEHNGWTSREWPEKIMIPDMKEMVNEFEPDLIFADGDNQLPGTDSVYWGSTEFLAWLYNDSPVKENVIVNDRWGEDCRAKNGGYWTHADRFDPGEIQEHKFENAMTIDKTWGYRKDIQMKDIKTPEYMIEQIVRTISCNGNILMNVGPTAEGTIAPIFEERLNQVGGWLKVNGEAIYASRPYTRANDTIAKDPEVWYTTSKDGSTVYGIALGWPMNQESTIELGSIKTGPNTEISLLGYQEPLMFSQGESSVTVKFPPLQKFIRECSPYCRWGYTMNMTNLA